MFTKESPHVPFDDYFVVTIPCADTTVPIDPKFIEICEPGTLESTSTEPDLPVLVGSRIRDGRLCLRFAEQRPDWEVRLVVSVIAIRRGFAGVRFPNRTLEEFEANERFIKSARPGGLAGEQNRPERYRRLANRVRGKS